MKNGAILSVFRFSLMKILEKLPYPFPVFSEVYLLLLCKVDQNSCVKILHFTFLLPKHKTHKNTLNIAEYYK